MRDISLGQALLQAAIMGAEASEYYSFSRHPRMRSHPKEDRPKYIPDVKRRTRVNESEFNIKGEKIVARNRKTALKIYALRHKKKGEWCDKYGCD
jgi:hypothetical protein